MDWVDAGWVCHIRYSGYGCEMEWVHVVRYLTLHTLLWIFVLDILLPYSFMKKAKISLHAHMLESFDLRNSFDSFALYLSIDRACMKRHLCYKKDKHSPP